MHTGTPSANRLEKRFGKSIPQDKMFERKLDLKPLIYNSAKTNTNIVHPAAKNKTRDTCGE